MRINGTNYWPHTDGAGSTVALTLDNGNVAERYEYADYGEPAFFNGSGNAISGSAVGNVYLWGGMRYDNESGLYFAGSFDPRVDEDELRGKTLKKITMLFKRGMAILRKESKKEAELRVRGNSKIVIRSEQYSQ